MKKGIGLSLFLAATTFCLCGSRRPNLEKNRCNWHIGHPVMAFKEGGYIEGARHVSSERSPRSSLSRLN